MLTSKRIPFTNANLTFWDVQTGDNIEQDTVTQKKIEELNKSVLPIEGTIFEATNESIERYVENFDSEYFSKA